MNTKASRRTRYTAGDVISLVWSNTSKNRSHPSNKKLTANHPNNRSEVRSQNRKKNPEAMRQPSETTPDRNSYIFGLANLHNQPIAKRKKTEHRRHNAPDRKVNVGKDDDIGEQQRVV